MAGFDVSMTLPRDFRIRVLPPYTAKGVGGDTPLQMPWIVRLDHELSLHLDGGADDLVRLRDAINAALAEEAG